MDKDSDDLQNPERIFIAGRLRHARKAEHLLQDAGIDYIVRVEPYGRSLLFGTIRQGAAFYVETERASRSREILASAGLRRGVVDDDSR